MSRQTIVACALARSADVAAEREGVRAVEGRRAATSVVLPSNPYLSLNGGRATDFSLQGPTAVWGVNLSQELEIAGQRGRRLDVASAERSAQERRLEAKARTVAADALLAYFDALSAVEEKRLADRLAALAEALQTLAQARVETGVGAPVEATVGRAQALRLLQARLTAERRVATSTATLATLLGHDPSRGGVSVDGPLEPLSGLDGPVAQLADAALGRRADLRVAEAERAAQAKRADVLRATRVPNPTLSLFLRNDWIGERTFGVGLGFPIPLPAPVGRTNAGEIAEASALGRRAGVEVERLRREVRLDVVKAAETFASWQRALGLFGPDDVRQAEESLAAVADELRARRLAARDALLLQQPLVELLLTHLETRRQLCFASVELARAAGLPLERGAP
ncbi:MAG TPA: TolC family protein [Polyangiaceae bacterium]|nr:TolC family protein [Polyangiaceae bacterium]